MPRLLLSYDLHDPNSAGRSDFDEELRARHWASFIVHNGKYYKLPNTTLVVNRLIPAAKQDIKAALIEGRKKDSALKVSRYVMAPVNLTNFKDDDRRDATKAEKFIYKMAMSGVRSELP